MSEAAPVTVETFVETMRAERGRWEALLARIDERDALLPGAAGGWSARDVIAHITAYERRLVQRLERALARLPYEASDADRLDMESRNRLWHEQSRGLSLQAVREDARAVFARALALVAEFDDHDLHDPYRFEPSLDEPPWQMIAGETFEHYHEHLPALQAFVEALHRADRR